MFAAPLGARWSDALGDGGLFGAQGLVFLGLFGAIAAVATWSAVRGRRAAAVAAAAAASAQAGPVGRAGAKAKAGTKGGTNAGAKGAAKGGAKGGAKAGTKPGAKSSVKAGAGAGAGGVVELSAEQQEVMRKLGGVLPLLSFATLITAAVLPLAAGLYMLTTTAWSVVERIWLQHRKERAEEKERAEREVDGGVRSSL